MKFRPVSALAAALLFLISVAGGHLIVFEAIPRLAMKATVAPWIAARGQANVALYPGLPNEQSRSVVLPSPDLAYVACAFDLSDGPVRVTVSIPETYWLASFFDMRTDTFATLGRSDLAGSDQILLATARQARSLEPSSAPTVIAPGRRGIVLVRMFVPDRAEYGALREAHQVRHSCEALQAS